jgi:hypothetical protein
MSTTGITSTTLSNVSGDANGDGRVDYKDLVILAASYGKQRGADGFDERADYNADGVIDYRDMLVLAANYGR